MPTDDRSTPPSTPVGPPGEPLRPLEAAELASAPFPYLRWAKAHLSWEAMTAGAPCLGMSGLEPLDAEARAGLGLSPPPEVGAAIANLKAALATRYALSPAHVHLAAGTSHANFAVYLALARGGRVAVETPGYEALHRLAHAVGADLALFARDPRRAYRVDPDSLAAAVDDRTDLIVLTDLHNPSGVRLAEDDLARALTLAHRHDAHVLVDEVYADFDAQERPSAATRDDRVITTNSLTKAHGLPDLRAGWILGAPEVIARIDAWDDLVHPSLPPGPMVDAAAYVPQAPARLPGLRAEAAARAAQVDDWVQATPRVSWTRPDGGLTGLLHLEGLDGDRVAAAAWADQSVRAVPGRFFQQPEALRISFMLPEAELATALDGLRRTLAGCA
ncbi:MAG: pyridoxal phosphate-dependent aminotransferase [Planctomycetota bacterium]|nr:pyridoxal phosphate-dependent aminotransferase [Planctomycetota bacterium]